MITMKELGKLAGVSQSAVSMIVNGRAKEFNISEETARKVLEIAKQNGFRPNAMARSMRTGHTGIVGILVSEESMRQMAANYGNNGNAMQLQAGFLLNGCRVMLESVSKDACEKQIMPELLTSGLADSIIVCENFTDEEASHRYLEKIHANFSRLLVVDDVSNDQIPSVTIDDVQAGRDAADYLWNLGHRKFGVLCSEDVRIALGTRLTAFQKRVAELSGGNSPVFSAFAGDKWQINCGSVAAAKLLAEHSSLPTAILAANDFFAYGAELEFLKRGISIPDDLSLVGIGEWPVAASAPVPITTFSMNMKEKIDTVLALWKKLQERPVPAVNDCRVKGHLIERKSTRRIENA
ncbi:MAG: LacI family DNA-binding transcriptional regulator [Victivallaceae bacterium]|nr:LacI family DNA-binding transcriptional regulator [Victivallaceae bacterium]